MANNFLNSKRFWIAIVIFYSIFLLKYYPFPVAGTVLLIAYLFNRKTIQPLKNYKFWIVIILLVVIVPLFTGSIDSLFFGISYSSEQLQKMLVMALRGISIFLLFQVLTTDLDITKTKAVFTKLGFNNFDTLYILSKKTLPRTKSILKARYTQFRDAWQTKRSISLLLDFLTEIFTDLIILVNQLDHPVSVTQKINPVELLESDIIKNKPLLIVITGTPGAGKTPWVEELIDLLRNKQQSVDGIISKKIVEDEEKWHHQITRISSGENRVLNTMDKNDTPVTIGKFYFHLDSIEWGCKQLISAKSYDWIIFDELGLLEFNGGGFLPALQTIANDFSGCLIITLRSNLVSKLDDFISKQLPEIQNWNRHIF